jgi:hypothetical protein
MPYIVSDRFIKELERKLFAISHYIDMDMYGEGIQSARQLSIELWKTIQYIRSHPELYAIQQAPSPP